MPTPVNDIAFPEELISIDVGVSAHCRSRSVQFRRGNMLKRPISVSSYSEARGNIDGANIQKKIQSEKYLVLEMS